ncbi:MAG: glycosyltransferase family 2 protein [Candidatus Aminicenantes bacterium]|nr:glycosyltransferase family 2 protein [Candidatus Aminicenantes bacterium]
MKPILSIVIPAYNEERRLGLSLRKIMDYLQSRGLQAEIIVVDDGSSDQTAAVAQEILNDWPRGRVIVLPKNLGKGAAVKEGILKASGEFILFSDADLSTPIEELEKMLPLAREGYEVVIASRALPGAEIKRKQSWLREHMGKTFNFFVQLLLLKGIKDTQCGFKLFRQEAARKIFSQLQCQGFAFDVETLWLARKLGYKIAQVPVVWINSPESKVRLFKSSVRMFFDLLKIKKRGTQYSYPNFPRNK